MSDLDRIDDTRLTIPLIEESIHVDKRQVAGAGYRLTKRITLHEEVVDTELQADLVTIERRPNGRVLAAGEHPVVRQEGNVTIYPVLKEVLVTEKRMVLIEEICITRTTHAHRDSHTVTLRREDIEIERMEAGESSASKQP